MISYKSYLFSDMTKSILKYHKIDRVFIENETSFYVKGSTLKLRRSEFLNLLTPIRTAVDDIHEYLFTVFQRK